MRKRNGSDDSPEKSDFVSAPEMLLRPVVRLAKTWTRENLQFVGSTWNKMMPYSLKSIRHRKWRSGMLATSVAVTIVVFVLFTSFYNATETAFRGEVQEVPMVADVAAYFPSGWSAEEVHRFNFARDAAAFDVGYRAKIYSSFGYEFVIGLDEGAFEPRSYPDGQRGDAHVTEGIELISGRWPQDSSEVVLPGGEADYLPVQTGDEFGIQWIDGEHRLMKQEYEIVGFFAVEDPLLDQPITRLPEEGQDLGPFTLLQAPQEERHIRPGGNLALFRSGNPQAVARWIQERHPEVQAITPMRGQEMASGLFWQVFSGGRLVVLLVMVFSALGVLNVLLLNFLERRRDMGIFKAEGTLNNEVRIMLMQEGFLMAVFGVTAGVVISWILVTVLDAYTLTPYLLSPITLLIAAVAAISVFYLGALVPAGMAQRMTVNELLYRRNIV